LNYERLIRTALICATLVAVAWMATTTAAEYMDWRDDMAELQNEHELDMLETHEGIVSALADALGGLAGEQPESEGVACTYEDAQEAEAKLKRDLVQSLVGRE
jgi:hypothetical protein